MGSVEELIQKLDRATHLPEALRLGSKGIPTTVKAVKDVLSACAKQGVDLPDYCYRDCKERYARHLLHKASDGSYSVVVMVWGPGQGTPLHDHAGKWCVEGVLKGQIQVTQYEYLGSSSQGELFEKGPDLMAGVGEAGHLIPPTEYHMITNPSRSEASMTLHVYANELTESTVFVPLGEKTYRREVHACTYME